MNFNKAAQSGFTIVSGLMMLAVVAGIAWVIVGFINNMTFLQVLSDRRTISDAFLVEKIEDLKQETYSGISQLCGLSTLTCVSSGALTTVVRPLTRSLKGTEYPFGVRFDSSGVPKATGDYCLQVKECRESSKIDLMDLVIALHFKDPDGRDGLRVMERAFRRAR
jgi:hypothetical protein